jgi:hypothetical protein
MVVRAVSGSFLDVEERLGSEEQRAYRSDSSSILDVEEQLGPEEQRGGRSGSQEPLSRRRGVAWVGGTARWSLGQSVAAFST